jgi:putative ABC transport system substrate-binding protein
VHLLYRRRLTVALTVTILACIAPVSGQAEDRLPKVGYLSFGAAVPPAIFQRPLSAAGYIEGRPLAIEYRFAAGRSETLSALARELIAARVDVITTVGDEAIAAAKRETSTVPIVMLACDAVKTGFISSLAHPGGNLTGITCLTDELSAKRTAIFRELVPSLSCLAVFYNPESIVKPDEVRAHSPSRSSSGSKEDIDRAFADLRADPPDGITVLDEARSLLYGKRFADLTLRHSLPDMHSFREPVDAGGLISYGPNLREMLATDADYVVRIIRGARPTDLPVEQPRHFELVINAARAKALGIAIPAALLARADEVIE